MNNVVRAAIEVPTGIIKALINNLIHGSYISPIAAISPMAEVTIDRGTKRVTIADHFRMREGARIRVRTGASLAIGKNVFINHGCIIVSRERVVIGDDVQFGPNVMIYDHDHDYRAAGGVRSMKFRTSPIIIGNNVWIGASVVILRGTTIGDNSVIGAGCVIKGNYGDNSVVIQKREG